MSGRGGVGGRDYCISLDGKWWKTEDMKGSKNTEKHTKRTSEKLLVRVALHLTSNKMLCGRTKEKRKEKKKITAHDETDVSLSSPHTPSFSYTHREKLLDLS